MKNKKILITGGTSGIGKQTAIQLANKGANIFICSRNESKGQLAADEISKITGNTDISFIPADFCSLHSVKSLVQQISEKTNRIDVLINNAGFVTDSLILTNEGIESQWSVNYFAPYLLTWLVLDNNMMASGSRIINVSASAHMWAKNLDFDFACKEMYSGKSVYAKTKLALNMFTFHLSRQLETKGITVNCLHPGVVRSQFQAKVLVPPAVIFKYFFKSPVEGAKTTVYLASDNAVEKVTGEYFIGYKPAKASEYSRNQAAQEKLNIETEKLVRLFRN